MRRMALGMALIVLCGLGAAPAQAEVKYEITPRLELGMEYDDNLYLVSEDEQSDFITTASPAVTLDMVSEKGNLALEYGPTFAWYQDHDENNTVRHRGSLTLNRALSKHLDFALSDTFLRSEDPLAESQQVEDVESVRETRNVYQRNTAQASLSYRFGPEDAVTGGLSHSWLENEDPALNDSTVLSPFVNVTYGLDVQNVLGFHYTYTDARFSVEDREAQDDYTGHSTGIDYTRKFSKHTSGMAGYDYTTRDFDGDTSDYDVHNPWVGVTHAFSAWTTVTAHVGYFFQVRDTGEDADGPSFDASLTRRFERGTLSLAAQGGWDEAFQEAEQRGFSQYWSVRAKGDYALQERLKGFAGLSYRMDMQEQEPADQEWTTWRADCGLDWSFRRWLSLRLTFAHAERDDDVDRDDYTDNRVMLLITGSRLFRW